MLQRPKVYDQTRRETKCHQIDQRIVFFTKLRGGIGQSSNPPVQTIHNHRDQYTHRRFIINPLGRKNYGVKTKEQTRGGEQTWKDINTFAVFRIVHFKSAIVSLPESTHCPRRTLSSISCGKYKSTREPNRINP